MKSIEVLLATYNGSDYIIQQINSILSNFEFLNKYECKILVSDDASTDNTVDIISKTFHDSRITIIDKDRKNGVKNNFNFLLNHATADFVFFCDQDDLWLPEKMKIFMEYFDSVPLDIPVLIHSDLCVAGKDLVPIHPSMFEYQTLNKNPSFANLLVSNSITGCVAAINNQLLTILKNSSIYQSIMHDWYAALVAAAYGQIIFIPKSLILYRQHGKNQVGAKQLKFSKIIAAGEFSKKYALSQLSVAETKRQAELFLHDFQYTLPADKLSKVTNYINSFDSNVFVRLYFFFFSGFNKSGLSRTIGFFIIYVLFGYRFRNLNNHSLSKS